VTDILTRSARAIRDALDRAARGLVEREVLVDLVALAAVAGEHLLVLGHRGPARAWRCGRWRARSAAATSSTCSGASPSRASWSGRSICGGCATA